MYELGLVIGTILGVIIVSPIVKYFHSKKQIRYRGENLRIYHA